jgi:F420-non-reducing hydrogenase large subunit
LVNHWPRVIEMVYAAERMEQLVNDPEITSPEVRRVPTNPPKVAAWAWSKPREAHSSTITRRTRRA